jgi:3-deoxy-manno-octulosonate cytidylyltransferase (CMP-KDO synthetase)
MRLEGAEVVVATDSPQVEGVVGSRAPVLMTSAECRNGTERVAEVMKRLSTFEHHVEAVVNVQPDQLNIPREAVLGALSRVLAREDEVGTAFIALTAEAAADVNRVKIATDASGHVRGFYRLAAWEPRPEGKFWLVMGEHLGIYAYRPDALRRWVALAPTPLEQALGLEQLRALEAGIKMGAAWCIGPRPLVIDTEADLKEAQRYYES